MKVSISVGGKFHAFYLAEQLQNKGDLLQLITSYPRFEVTKSGINKDKIKNAIKFYGNCNYSNYLKTFLNKTR